MASLLAEVKFLQTFLLPKLTSSFPINWIPECLQTLRTSPHSSRTAVLNSFRSRAACKSLKSSSRKCFDTIFCLSFRSDFPAAASNRTRVFNPVDINKICRRFCSSFFLEFAVFFKWKFRLKVFKTSLIQLAFPNASANEILESVRSLGRRACKSSEVIFSRTLQANSFDSRNQDHCGALNHPKIIRKLFKIQRDSELILGRISFIIDLYRLIIIHWIIRNYSSSCDPLITLMLF